MYSRKNDVIGELPLRIAKSLHKSRVQCNFRCVLIDNRYGGCFSHAFRFFELRSDLNLHDVAVKHLPWFLADERAGRDSASQNLQSRCPSNF